VKCHGGVISSIFIFKHTSQVQRVCSFGDYVHWKHVRPDVAINISGVNEVQMLSKHALSEYTKKAAVNEPVIETHAVQLLGA
jgi:hypothetical protein